MTPELEKYHKIMFWGRVSAFLFLGTFAVVYFLDETSNPTLYLGAFVAFQLSALSMIGLGIYQWRYKKKHGIHHHG
ncbi:MULTISPECIES: hypothetical protein [unclassified Erythrobacter]|mgnify:CR=1 FL=1|uniref:hypothetical protein n=1 Tax=unclassified Erythrobacter TaxID=2633097 RepID=UPI0007BAA08E|nr:MULTISPECIES: hypothetical protein [unclassified Erythrobacter]